MTVAPIIPSWTKLDNASDRLKWYQNRGALKLYFMISILFMGEALDGYDGTLLSGLQAIPAWKKDVGYPNASKLGLLSSARALGGLVFGPISAYAGDRWGRRWCLRFYAITMVLGTILAVIAGSGVSGGAGYGLYITSQAIIGAGLAVGLQVSIIMMQEITHPRTRHIIAALFDSQWALGQVGASWTIFGTSHIQNSSWAWRIPVLIQLVGAFYIAIATFLVPESPRFLLDKGRNDEALSFLIEYHANGDPTDKLVLFEFEEMKRTLALEKEAGQNSWSTVLYKKGNLRRLGVLCMIVFMAQLNGSRITQVYYTVQLKLAGVTGTTTLTGIGAGLSMWGVCTQIMGTYAISKLKRRTIVLSTWPCLLVIMIALCITTQQFIASHNKNKHIGIASVAMVWLFAGANNFVSPLLFSYPGEILPYAIRGKFMALWTCGFQITSIYSNYVNSIALANISWRYYIVYISFIALQCVLAYFFFVETSGYTLEEVALAFEGDAAKVAVVDAELGAVIGSGSHKEPSIDEKVPVV